jgi:hypothetical protein
VSNYFCDTQLTTGANNGTSMDDAWQSIKTALENIVMVAGDILWIRRRSGFWNPAANIAPIIDGTLKQPLRFLGWPRPLKAGTGTFENGSNVVDGVSFTPKFEQHVGRYVKNDADGRNYLLTAIAHKINYDNKTGDFTEGLMLIGGSSGLEAKIHRIKDNGDGTGTLWTVTKARELIDRGNCEDDTSPMIFGEFVPTMVSISWVKDSAQAYAGTYSYKLTKLSAAGGNGTVRLMDNILDTDMHGLVVNKTYKWSIHAKIPSSGLLGSEVAIHIFEYISSSWISTSQLAANVYDVWQKIEISRTIQPTTTAVLIVIEVSSSAELNEYFNVDEMKLCQVFEEDEQITDEDTGVADIVGDPTDDGIIIDRPYVGVNETGALTIAKDEDYDLAQVIDDSSWTIKKSDYNGDADDLPIVDFGEAAYYIYNLYSYNWIYKNLYFRNGTLGPFSINTSDIVEFINCLFSQMYESRSFYTVGGTKLYLLCCVMRGRGQGYSYNQFIRSYAQVCIKDCAFYDIDGAGIMMYYLKSVDGLNYNVEIHTSDNSLPAFSNAYTKILKIKDFKHDHSPLMFLTWMNMEVHVENYQKVLGAHKAAYDNGEITKVDVLYDSGDPYKRPSGADSVIEVTANGYASREVSGLFRHKVEIFCHEIWADKVSRSYRYYVQCKNMSCVSTQLWLEVEYIDQFEGETKYHYIKIRSDEACVERTGVDDWSQYIEVTDIQSAVEGWVRIRAYIAHYDVDGMIFIDPKVEIT